MQTKEADKQNRENIAIIAGGAAALIASSVLTAAAFFPVAALPLSLIAAPFIAASKKLFSAAPFIIVAAYGIAALIFNFDLLTLLSVVALAAGFAAHAVISAIKDNYLIGGAVGLLTGGAAAVILAISVCGATGVTPSALCRDYVESHADSAIIRYAAHRYFDKLETAEEKPSEDSPQYDKRAISAYAEYIRQTMSSDFVYHVTNYGALTGLLIYFCGVWTSKTANCAFRHKEAGERKTVVETERASDDFNGAPNAAKDKDSTGGTAEKNANAAGALCTPFALMRLGRPFLWTVFLPVLVFSVLGLIDFMQPIVAAAFNLTVVLPCAFEGLCLALYIARLCDGKKLRTALYIIIGVLGCAALLVPIVTLIFSVFGFTDCLMNMRKLFDIVKRGQKEEDVKP